MLPDLRTLLGIAVLCTGLFMPYSASADSLKEAWFLMRSRANMKIGNYAAAIEAYEKYLELQPDDREALKGIALAHERQGQTDKAIARYDIYLQKYSDDADTAFKQANYLTWSRYAYRKKDAIEYLKMGLAVEDDPRQRLKYARLLADDKYDLDEAVQQYEVLLERDPSNDGTRGEYRKILLWDDRYLDRAIVEHERLVDDEPEHFDNRRQLATLLGKKARRRKDAASLYRKLVDERRNDFALRHEYARVLARIDGEFDEARQQYEILVAKRPVYDILDEYGALLANRPSAYPDAIATYSRMLAIRPGDTRIRLRRASLYMTAKASAPSALDDYRRVLEAEPRNVQAHRGAAQAYAWLGESDNAYYHSNLALRYGDSGSDTATLQQTLYEGREPRVSLALELPWQRGGDFELQGLSLGARLSIDPSPFITAFAAVGTERYEDQTDDASGSWYRAGGQYRLDAHRRIDAEIGSRSIRRVGERRAFSFTYREEALDAPWSYAAGLKRSAVGDSFQSLVGDGAASIGGATRDEVFLAYSRDLDLLKLTATPSIGRIESASERSNQFIEVAGSVEFPIDFQSRFDTALGYDALFAAYARDHSGFVASAAEPFSGGYFSPQLLFDQYPHAKLKHTFADAAELEVKLGLRFQFVDDATVSGKTSNGAAGSVSYLQQTTPSQYLILKAEHHSVADRYERTFLQGQLLFIF